MKQIFLICAAMVLLLGCGKKAPEQQAEPKVELTEAKLTPGMEAALKADEAGNYPEAARLYIVELAAEEVLPKITGHNAQLGAIMSHLITMNWD